MTEDIVQCDRWEPEGDRERRQRDMRKEHATIIQQVNKESQGLEQHSHPTRRKDHPGYDGDKPQRDQQDRQQRHGQAAPKGHQATTAPKEEQPRQDAYLSGEHETEGFVKVLHPGMTSGEKTVEKGKEGEYPPHSRGTHDQARTLYAPGPDEPQYK